MSQKIPTLGAKSFSCPRCGALANQTWFNALAHHTGKDTPPRPFTKEFLEDLKLDKKFSKELLDRIERLVNGEPLFFPSEKAFTSYTSVDNLHFSLCFSCDDISIWVGTKIIYPNNSFSFQPNEDMPHDVRNDFEEAASIISSSPRGASALLRLAIQKLCVYLGCSGKNINNDIAHLVKNGLDPRIQKAMDVVRVVGNESVHPGTMDLKDDIETASQLFRLVNLVVETQISSKKHIDELYAKLPEDKLKQIEKRDGGSE